MFTVVKAQTPEQIKDAQNVRYVVYYEQDKKFQDKVFPEKIMEIKHHDYGPNTIVLVAYYEEKPVGTISTFEYSEQHGLPIEDTVTLFKDKFDLEEFIKKREFEIPLYSCGMLAIHKDFRGSSGISIWLYRFIFELVRRQGCKDVIITINYKLEKTMLLIGFKHLVFEDLVPQSRYSKEIGNHVFLMYAKTDDLKKVLELQDIPNWCKQTFADSTRINIYHNEDIIVQGTVGEEFFLILEGSVKVVLRTRNRNHLLAILYQGMTFGEMALFGGERTATVFSNDCAVKEVTREEFLKIVNDRDKAESLTQVLIERLGGMNNKIKDVESRKKLIRSLLELNGNVNSLVSDNSESESFLENFKNWILNYFKTADLQKRISVSESQIDDQIPKLTIEIIEDDFGASREEIEELFKQLIEGGVLRKTEKEEFCLIDEDKLKNFIFDF